MPDLKPIAMLNISRNPVSIKEKRSYTSLHNVELKSSGQVLSRLVKSVLILMLIILFIPWTQNIQSRGKVTTLKPEQRPQTIQSRISGRIEEWFVQEGDFVHAGDTVLRISEIINEYLDPKMLQRVQEQIDAKQQAVESYTEKINMLEKQITALRNTAELKARQLDNKRMQAEMVIESDSIAYEAAQTGYRIAKVQYDRMVKLYEGGLKSLTEVEKRLQNLQMAQAEMIAKENKLLTSKNKLINVIVEKSSIQAQYNEKISKAESEKFATLSKKFEAEAIVTKLQNQYANYALRTGMYFITAPQTGYITQTIQSGIGETIKEGEAIVSIMPEYYELAVEMYVKPIDLPLMNKGQNLQIQFDGWPAIIFSGWPNISYGTYGGTVYAIDNFISPNGLYRIMVAPDPEDHPWPSALRIGAGTRNMILLKDVPVWYELWRKINGFPPDYYQPVTGGENKGTE